MQFAPLYIDPLAYLTTIYLAYFIGNYQTIILATRKFPKLQDYFKTKAQCKITEIKDSFEGQGVWSQENVVLEIWQFTGPIGNNILL